MPNPGQFIVICRVRITTDYINSKTEFKKTIENLMNKIYDFFFINAKLFAENIKQNK